MINSNAINYKLKKIASFVSATENEIAADKMLFALAGITPEKAGFFPRPPKWINYGRRLPFLTYSFWWVARWGWIFGGSHVFFFCQFFPAWLRARKIDERCNEAFNESGYVLALSSRVGDIVHSGHVEDLPCTWITMPWAPLKRVPADAKCIEVFSLLSKSDIWYAFQDAVIATHILHKRKRTSRWILQSYTAFRWFAVRTALDKLPGRLIMADHFDRWAVLVDSSVQAHKFQLGMSGEDRRRDLVLIQHGVLGSLGESKCQAAKLKLRRKLRTVTQLYAYNAENENVFKEDVLSPGCVRRCVKVSYYQPGIELKVDKEYQGLKLLFVGHSLCEALHQYVFDSLARDFEFRAYYKPHPRALMSEQMHRQTWKVINDVGYFPVVDLLISYPSTLVVEYSGFGVPAMVHAINLSKDASDDFIYSVVKKLESIKKNRKFNNNTFVNISNEN